MKIDFGFDPAEIARNFDEYDFGNENYVRDRIVHLACAVLEDDPVHKIGFMLIGKEHVIEAEIRRHAAVFLLEEEEIEEYVRNVPAAEKLLLGLHLIYEESGEREEGKKKRRGVKDVWAAMALVWAAMGNFRFAGFWLGTAMEQKRKDAHTDRGIDGKAEKLEPLKTILLELFDRKYRYTGVTKTFAAGRLIYWAEQNMSEEFKRVTEYYKKRYKGWREESEDGVKKRWVKLISEYWLPAEREPLPGADADAETFCLSLGLKRESEEQTWYMRYKRWALEN